MPRGLSDEDREVWAAFVHGAPKRRVASPTPAAAPARKPRGPAPLVTGAHPAGLDSGTWTRFRTGRLTAERTLDLHGRTVAAAHAALLRFVAAAHAEQARCVEVITGKGSGEGGGAIRRELPLWLNAPPLRGVIVAVVHPHAANTGAVRLLIRRVRSGRPGR